MRTRQAELNAAVVNVPNILTMFRLLLVPPMAIYLADGRLALAGWLFAIAAVTDFADGWIARRFNATTTFGRLVDPIADKALVGTAVALLWWQGLLPGWFALVVALRESFVVGASVMARATGRSAEIRPGPFGKLGAAVQMLLIGCILLPLPAPFKAPGVLAGLMILATALTLVSAVRYALRWIRARRTATAA
jgi:CDP-diacylglycerol--glycerol-3-phosphate 3-phosphatidyltransferase